MLNPEGDRRGGGEFRAYLADALKANKSWDKIFREVMLPDESDAKLKGAADFLRGRVSDADKLTNDVSVAFFGVNVSCAQCHDHPLVEDWTQDHFYGMKAFLARTFDNGGFLGERGYGTIKYKPTKGPETHREDDVPDRGRDRGRERQGAERRRDEGREGGARQGEGREDAAAAPKFSARAKLVEVALQGRRTRTSSRGRSPTGCGTASSAPGW